MIDAGLYLTYVFFFVALGAAIVLPLLHALKHPKELGKSAIAVGVLVIVFLVAYSLSDSSVNAKAVALGVDESSSKLIGAGLILFYIVFGGALLGIIYSEINKALK
ncbi:MAG: hypothetical protein ACOYXA_03535 [Bacteroidota bacterium]